MKNTKTCPKCACPVLWHVRKVAANNETGELQEHPTFHLAVVGNGLGGKAGTLEAYACQQCGYTEFYLRERLTADGTHIDEVRAAAAPYRT